MQLLNYLPRYLRKHKVLSTLVYLGIQKNYIPITFNKDSRAYIDLNDPEPRNVFIKGEFEPDFFKIAEIFLLRNGTFFDVGANVGFCTFGLTKKKPAAAYHLFEANPLMLNLLKKSIKMHKKQSITLENCCVSNKKGKILFQLNSGQSGQSHVSNNQGRGIEVNAITLDDYCVTNEIKFVHFAKLDIEGHELAALQGWEKMLSHNNIGAILIEIIPENQKRYNLQTSSPLSFLESKGYELFAFKTEDQKALKLPSMYKNFYQSKLKVSKIIAKKYPNDYATDILAVKPNLS